MLIPWAKAHKQVQLETSWLEKYQFVLKISMWLHIDISGKGKEIRRQPAVSFVARLKKKSGLLSAAAVVVVGTTTSDYNDKTPVGHCDNDCANCRLTTGIAMVAGTTGRAISTAVNLAATRGMEVCKRHKIYIA